MNKEVIMDKLPIRIFTDKHGFKKACIDLYPGDILYICGAKGDPEHIFPVTEHTELKFWGIFDVPIELDENGKEIKWPVEYFLDDYIRNINNPNYLPNVFGWRIEFPFNKEEEIIAETKPSKILAINREGKTYYIVRLWINCTAYSYKWSFSDTDFYADGIYDDEDDDDIDSEYYDLDD